MKSAPGLNELCVTIPDQNTCALTGANGFVGRKLKDFLERNGWDVIPWVRRPAPGSREVEFFLGQAVNSNRFEGVRALVHAAYDFGPRSWSEIAATNVAGSTELLLAAQKAGVDVIVLISSLSAFPGSRSLYGRAKMQIEQVAASVGARIIRPGLVYGSAPGGMFGRLVKQVRSSRVLPILQGGRQTQYLLHSDDLGALVLACVKGQLAGYSEPLTVAHERPWQLKELLARIGQTIGRSIRFVPVPWQIAWLGLRTLEIARVPTNFRSDSLISMVFQNPRPAFASVDGLTCRPFEPTIEMLGGRRSDP